MNDLAYLDSLAALFQTSAKNAAIRAAKLKLTPPCSRCGGSGVYSFNPIDGDRCFACRGAGHTSVTPSNIARVITAAKAAIADGRHAAYLEQLANRAEAAKMRKRIFSVWKKSAAALGNPTHTLPDAACTPRQLACRQANAKIAAAYKALQPLDIAYKRNPSDDDHLAWKKALDAFFAVIVETDRILSEAKAAA